jgi:alpha-L-fucosidase 2
MRNYIPSMLSLMILLFSCSRDTKTSDSLSSFETAKLHPIFSDRPALGFFEGPLLGNGAMGVVVTTRPDAIVLYFGHNNIWDIRLGEGNKEKIGTFKEIFNRIKAIPDTLSFLSQDPWYREYNRMTTENYNGKTYPRPFPCGSVLIGFDRRKAEMTGHRLDISNGLCEVMLKTKDQKDIRLQIFTDMTSDKLWMRLVDQNGNLCENVFDRMRIFIDPSTPAEFPKAKIDEELSRGVLSFRQTLPYSEPDKSSKTAGRGMYEDFFTSFGSSPGTVPEKNIPVKVHAKDKAFRLTATLNGPLEKTTRIDWNGNKTGMSQLEGSVSRKDDFIGYITLQEGLNKDMNTSLQEAAAPHQEDLVASLDKNTQIWKEYWNKSGVKLSDQFLERMWYHNLYFLNCATSEGAITPGLYANWSYNKIGTVWHGDYHMNYNFQQPFWVTFSSNHLEKNLPYVNTVEFLMDVSTRWAKEYFELPGAYFPHTAYPVDMTMNPYPAPDWGWQVSETPWAVQGLWWHYLYSGDTGFLKTRAYGPIKAAVEFLVAYMKRPEARGPQWKDDKYHIFPTVPPELYGLRPGFKYNYDCNVDLTLTKFIFNAFIETTRILNLEAEEKELLSDIGDILSHYPEYPTAVSKDYGKILVSVPGEHDQVVYNVPNALFTVFPGEDHGLHSDTRTLEILKNTYRNQQNEGGNDLVFINLQAARLGMLNLEKFKRQVNYCLLPNGTATLRVMQVHGRYNDRIPYDFMEGMGIWFENFSLPVVVNECLMQSYDGTIRFFPNWPMDKDAEFHNLRAAGAFLVSASLKDSKVKEIEIVSETGGLLKVILPWEKGGTIKSRNGIRSIKSALVEIKTDKGETILFKP